MIWFITCGLGEISPRFAEIGIHAPMHCWIAVSFLVLILTTLVTYRMVIDHSPLPDTQLPFVWRQNPNRYFHEWRFILFILAISVAFFLVGIYEMWRWVVPGIHHNMWVTELRDWPFYKPDNLFWLCLIFLALYRAFARKKDPGQLQARLPRINPAKFITVWIAALAVIITGIPTLIWMSFALWFNPWCCGRWP